MIGKEDQNNEEQPALKVTDKRKFNPDGSLREGVTLESEKPKQEETPIIDAPKETADPLETAAAEGAAEDFEDDSDLGLYGADVPGADDPASFVNFLSTLASQAAAALGAMPHPVTGQRTVDLETGKYWIDVLLMLRDKTDGNLHPQEKRLFEGLLSDLQMQYVALTRATEEKLKQQAAQKFSAKDILGG
ncbi:MAG: DUF1844 domain-containing protein [Pyrinomonadaceae bacterium]